MLDNVVWRPGVSERVRKEWTESGELRPPPGVVMVIGPKSIVVYNSPETGVQSNNTGEGAVGLLGP